MTRGSPSTRRLLPTCLPSVAATGLPCLGAGAPPIPIEEATIASVHAAFKARKLTCSQLVTEYLKRIAAYDKKFGVNSIQTIMPDVMKEAARMDDMLRAGGSLPPLFCVPMIVSSRSPLSDCCAAALISAGTLIIISAVCLLDARACCLGCCVCGCLMPAALQQAPAVLAD